MIKHLLVHVDATPAGETCLRYAIALARQLDARLTGIHITPPAEAAPLYRPSQIGAALDRIEKNAGDRAEAAEACFRKSTSETDLRCDWKSLSGEMAEGISKAARFADLTVLSQTRWPGPPLHHPLSLAEVALMKCAGPVLIVPEAAEPSVPAKALVSWDGSRQAARALHHAIPLIQGCCTSIEVACRDGAETTELEDLVEHLARHGITVFRSNIKKPGPFRSAGLIERWRDDGFDLVIMGAFGRAPWREILFGGPTLAVTRQTGMTLLASH